MEEDADAAAPVKRAADEVVGDDEPSAKKPKQEDGPDPVKPAGEGDDDGLGTDDDDDDDDDDAQGRHQTIRRAFKARDAQAHLLRPTATRGPRRHGDQRHARDR